MALPDVVSRAEWLLARKALLAREKENLRGRDAINADRRRLPMVRAEADYRFGGPDGEVGLADLFRGHRQLLLRHVMFGPDWDGPCVGCTSDTNQLTRTLVDEMDTHDISYVLCSRAPYEKIAAVKAARGWDKPFVRWYSSYGSDFNYDFQVSLDESRPQLTYNYRTESDLGEQTRSVELPGASCFVRDGADIFHTYSTYARGTEYLNAVYPLLDLTVLGRQEDWEEPKDRNEKPMTWDPESLWTRPQDG
jgi:predicted dithiol-disulfide oxidoreductase (DUF899 family)